ncbi:hypothetical protein P9133_02195 [Bacillus thuringiensis]|uniref:Uncharacterized protein n=1 Tax=Bacillus thuringiensis HD-771 TaxID=1218175 RepID=A0A9W3JJ79_BACTU|nr:hypothetical protein [Bacillus thuringiensis]AFQ19674.1 hypothetical protein BTG_31688 [Bacillus thuringiensis HD-771]MEC3263294.1 hypothetical protein [Bacillus thuringiensis]MEC3510497.1 hypothetical protein [Bacillus thuringiensis]MED2071357.1 hypothetical protein [Bacillus thuringiensis]MED2221059.1 hypothetical protein [Bacillus thuringiensis]
MENEHIKVTTMEKMYQSAMCLILLGNGKSNFPIEQSREIFGIVEVSSIEFSSILKVFQKNEQRITKELEQGPTNSSAIREKEFEIETSAASTLVLLLSRLEETLAKLIDVLTKFDSNLPKQLDPSSSVMNEYLNFFEKFIDDRERNFIVGTRNYNLLIFWQEFRDNIVYRYNQYDRDILQLGRKLKKSISYDLVKNKFKIQMADVISLAELCGLILDKCITNGLYRYFGIDEWAVKDLKIRSENARINRELRLSQF